MIQTVNPSNGKVLKQYAYFSDKQIKEAVNNAHEAFQSWKKTSRSHCSMLLTELASLLRKNKDEYAMMITNEMGKVLSESNSEIEKCAWVCEYYADKGASFLEDHVIETEASKAMVTYRPLGIILAIMPWNFPFWQVFRFAVPTLFAGNVGLLKHAPNVTGCALLIQSIFEQVGFPKGVFQTLIAAVDQLDPLYEDPRVSAITLTGSTQAGRQVAEKAGRNLKKVVLELGGSDPYLILQDADVEMAVETCLTSRMINTGQSCIAAKRFIVDEKHYPTFIALLKEKMEQLKLGDPKQAVDLGPMARPDLRDQLHRQVIDSVAAGETCLLGGDRSSLGECYYPPTLLIDVSPGMKAFDEELFGPVAVVIKAEDTSHAIELANQSSFGLGAALFTSQEEAALKHATEDIEAGSCFINDLVKSDPRLPFGGIKNSGYGRELGSFGIKEFVNTKTVLLK
jgi:succinate-semialdehyde dehydrogenase/glutarate-semialdehyde dehydrogenase